MPKDDHKGVQTPLVDITDRGSGVPGGWSPAVEAAQPVSTTSNRGGLTGRQMAGFDTHRDIARVPQHTKDIELPPAKKAK